MNIRKVRRIVRGLNGLSTSLIGNPYMQSDGMAYPVKESMDAITNAYQQDLQQKQNLVASKNTDLGKLRMAQKLAGTSQGFGSFLKNNAGSIGQGIDTLQNFGLFQGYKADNSSVANGVRQGYDFVADNVFKVNPVVGGWMKAAGLAGDIMSSMGMTTDQMTGFDKVMGGIPVLGNLMSIGAKKTHDFSLNKQAAEQVGGSYGGFMDLASKAQEGAGKKYSVFSSGARRMMNRKIDLANNQQNTIVDIADEAADQQAIATSMAQLNHIRAGFTLNGGLDQRYMRAAKFGAKLKRVKRINFRKQGGEIVGAINLDNWQPVITEAVEQFENGGGLEWTPVITLQDGGQVEKWDFKTWFNSIPSQYRAPQYDYQMAFNVLDKETLKNHAKDPDQFHLPSVSGIEDKDGRIPFLKLGKRGENKEVDKEFAEFYEHDRGKDFRSKYDVIYYKDRYYYVPKKFQKGGKTEELLNLAKEYYKDYDLSGINLIEDKSPRTEGNNIYISNDEDVIHELWHYLSKNKPNEKYKEFYDNLDDGRIKSLGGDLDFVKRMGDPSIFYHPSEIESRVKAAKYKSKGVNYTKDFFKALRNEDENKYGYNMRDLLHMYNDENLEKIFNLKNGGELSKGESELEETNQKNLIPEGALHAHKHHMENADNITKKGIPVIDNEGEQQAEIERNEIIFTLEVTKALENLYSKYFNENSTQKDKDEVAIEAGKLLVEEILFNTDDRTNLISKCKEGGKINGIE